MSPHIKKLRTSEYNHFEVTQLLFEAFLDIIKNKRDIQEKRLNSKFPEREKCSFENSILY